MKSMTDTRRKSVGFGHNDQEKQECSTNVISQFVSFENIFPQLVAPAYARRGKIDEAETVKIVSANKSKHAKPPLNVPNGSKELTGNATLRTGKNKHTPSPSTYTLSISAIFIKIPALPEHAIGCKQEHSRQQSLNSNAWLQVKRRRSNHRVGQHNKPNTNQPAHPF